MTISGEFLDFVPILSTGTTGIWNVCNKQGALLGVVRWWGAWRAYTFLPSTDCRFDSKCLGDIGAFLVTQTVAFWKRKREKTS